MHYSFLSKASRCSIQQGTEPLSAWFLCAHLFVFVVPCIFNSHPSLFPFAMRGSGIKPYCFHSISRHYQQQSDYWVHLAAGEWWRQLAVFSFTLPPILSSLLERIKWGLSVRNVPKPMCCLILLNVLMSTNTIGQQKGSDKKEHCIPEQLTTWASCRRRQI